MYVLPCVRTSFSALETELQEFFAASHKSKPVNVTGDNKNYGSFTTSDH